MRIYLSSPRTQQQADACRDLAVLFSFTTWAPWLERYAFTFSRLLIDSGAFSELGGKKVEVAAYKDWAAQWVGHVDAIAALDDIAGDWRRSLRNYDAMPESFPTFHDTDPPELLHDLLARADGNGRWIGIGIKPPRNSKREWLQRTLEQIPDRFHVHGWALRAYSGLRRIDSVDCTTWWREAMRLARDFPWLTYGETLELTVKKIIRSGRLSISCSEGQMLLDVEGQ